MIKNKRVSKCSELASAMHEQRWAKRVVAYLHRDKQKRAVEPKRSPASTASANRQLRRNQTLSKRRGRSLVSRDQHLHFSGKCELVAASVTSNRRASSPLVRGLYESETREASSRASGAPPSGMLSSPVPEHSSLEQRLQGPSRTSVVSWLPVR